MGRDEIRERLSLVRRTLVFILTVTEPPGGYFPTTFTEI